MKLLTEIPIKHQPKHHIDYHAKMLLLGSCFVENMGKKLDYYKFRNLQNPFGVLFQPKAIETLVKHALEEKIYEDSDVFFFNDRWQSFEAHSKLSSASKDEVLSRLNEAVKNTNHALRTSSHIVITLGTAWVYRQLETGKHVANCHKVPQNAFKKELFPSEDIVTSLQNILNQIQAVNPKASLIFTVSPIRHIKDGFIENTRSKSHLISAIHQVLDTCNSEHCHYFPAYEIMMDELRDYRFYTSDLIHPNQVAIDYIWEKFVSAWFAEPSKPTMKAIDSIQKGLQHKPFNEASENHKKFRLELDKKIAAIQAQFNYISFKS